MLGEHFPGTKAVASLVLCRSISAKAVANASITILEGVVPRVAAVCIEHGLRMHKRRPERPSPSLSIAALLPHTASVSVVFNPILYLQLPHDFVVPERLR